MDLMFARAYMDYRLEEARMRRLRSEVKTDSRLQVSVRNLKTHLATGWRRATVAPAGHASSPTDCCAA